MSPDPFSDPPPESPGERGAASGDGEPEPTPEELAWRAIVDNYGERAVIDDPEPTPPRAPEHSARPEPVAAEEDEHFVPPQPPPLPKPPPDRMLAWVGLFGVPMLVLAAVVLGLSFPSWLSVLLLGWFVGGFVFLVATMRPRPDDPDDGAVV